MSAPPDLERHAGRLAPAGAALAVVGVCAGGWGGLLLALVGAFLLLASCVSARDGLLLVGPFARAELVRIARKRRPWLWRAVYALAAGAILLGNVWDTPAWSGGGASRAQLARLNEQVTAWFAVCLFGYIGVLTLQVMTGVVAEEREASRWDVLLATDLRAREVLIGKAAGRLPEVLDPVLAALPVLALMPLLGGVSPVLLGWATVAVLATVLGATGVAFFYSTFSPTARAASGSAFGLAFGYLVASAALLGLMSFPLVWTFPASVGVTSPVELGDAVEAFAAGNPGVAVYLADRGATGPDGFEGAFAVAVRRLVAFHAAAFALFGFTAVARLRGSVPWAAAKRQKVAEKALAADPARRPTSRPPVGDAPVYWWQRYGGLTPVQLRVVGALTVRRYVFYGLACLAGFVALRVADRYHPWRPGVVLEVGQGLIGVALWFVSWCVMVPPAIRAAKSVVEERAAGTLEALQLTALSPRDILYQKWLGAATSELPLYLVMVTVSVAAMFAGFVHPLSAVGLAITVPIYTAAVAGVGTYFSVRAATPTRAVRNMVLVTLGVAYVIGTAVGASLAGRNSQARGAIVAPPAVTGMVLAAGPLIWDGRRDPERVERDLVRGLTACLAGPAVWAVAGWVCWAAAVRRFERERAQ